MIWLEPLVEIDRGDGRVGYGPVAPEDVAALLDGKLESLGPVEAIPFFARQTRLTFARCGLTDPLDYDDYQAHGGLAGLRRVIAMSQEEIVQEVTASGLRGRGGAGFPTGIKWKTVMQAEAMQKYIVCNADEGDSGTFADRMIMEGDPFTLIEGMAIAGIGVGATRGYVYLRSEYPDAIRAMNAAVGIARRRGLLGPSVLGSDHAFEMEIRVGAGAYVCGEETSLLNSLEGKRGVVRAKPPLPAIKGLFQRPTVVNNVETLCNVPAILRHGVEWYQGLSGGRSDDGGTKLYGVSGRVNEPGLWELPIGTTGQELLDLAGGIRDGKALKTWLPGGGSTGFLLPEHLELPLDFDTVGQYGSRMGTGLLTVVTEEQSVVSLLRNLEQFFARESCGWCTPCRDGLPRRSCQRR